MPTRRRHAGCWWRLPGSSTCRGLASGCEPMSGVRQDLLFVEAEQHQVRRTRPDPRPGRAKRLPAGGRCFYCRNEVPLAATDVDHVFPWVLKEHGEIPDADCVWNLVLACRGVTGASAASSRLCLCPGCAFAPAGRAPAPAQQLARGQPPLPAGDGHAPDWVDGEILDGRQPEELGLPRLLEPFALEWTEPSAALDHGWVRSAERSRAYALGIWRRPKAACAEAGRSTMMPGPRERDVP